MESINCLNCETVNPVKAKYCKSCGNKLTCENCGETLEKNANNCIICGHKVGGDTASTRNTIKYNWTPDNVNFDANLSDDVAKSGLSELFNNVIGRGYTNNKQITERIDDTTLKVDTIEDEEFINQASKNESVNNSSKNNLELPHLNDLLLSIECSEVEWLAIFAYYESNFGNSTFTRSNILEKYKEKRGTKSRIKNFHLYWNRLIPKYIATVKEGEFKIKDDIKPKIVDLIRGTLKGSAKKISKSKSEPKEQTERPTSPKTANRTPVKSPEIEDFDVFKGPNKPSLKDFFMERGVGESSTERVLAIAYYITQLNKSKIFTEGNIDYAYKAISLSNRINNLRQTITNLKTTKVWFNQATVDGKKGWSLERVGEIYFEEHFPKKP